MVWHRVKFWKGLTGVLHMCPRVWTGRSASLTGWSIHSQFRLSQSPTDSGMSSTGDMLKDFLVTQTTLNWYEDFSVVSMSYPSSERGPPGRHGTVWVSCLLVISHDPESELEKNAMVSGTIDLREKEGQSQKALRGGWSRHSDQTYTDKNGISKRISVRIVEHLPIRLRFSMGCPHSHNWKT